MKSNAWGAIHIVLHTMIWTVYSARSRVLCEALNPMQVTFVHTVFALILMIIFFVYRKGFKIVPNKIHFHILRSVFSYAATIALFYSLTKVPFIEAVTLIFTYPLVATIFAVIFLKESISVHRFVAVIIGFIGVLIIVRPWSASFNIAILLIFLTIILWGFTDVFLKYTVDLDDTDMQLLHICIWMTILSAPLGILYWEPVNHKQIIELLYLQLDFCLHMYLS